MLLYDSYAVGTALALEATHSNGKLIMLEQQRFANNHPNPMRMCRNSDMSLTLQTKISGSRPLSDRVFYNSQNGCAAACFYVSGKWRFEIVDDLLPGNTLNVPFVACITVPCTQSHDVTPCSQCDARKIHLGGCTLCLGRPHCISTCIFNCDADVVPLLDALF